MVWTTDAPTKAGAYWATLRLGQEPTLLRINDFGQIQQFNSRELLSFHYDVYCWWSEEVKPPPSP